MRHIISPGLLYITLIASFIFSQSLKAQSLNIEQYQYLSPKPNAKMVMPETRILIKYGKAFEATEVLESKNLSVIGSKSGSHVGELILVGNDQVLSFTPDKPFVYGEKVSVELQNRFKLKNGGYSPYLKYSFTITEKKIDFNNDPLAFIESEMVNEGVNYKSDDKSENLVQDSLPDDFPNLVVSNNNPSDGYIFFSPFSFLSVLPSYLIITDNWGMPVFYKKIGGRALDFKKQPDGDLTFYYPPSHSFKIMNRSYEIIDSLKMQNGYTADPHELRMLNDGHSFMLCYDQRHVSMDTVVAGGNPNAIVTGLVLQELDSDDNVVFQWRSWDHFKITDATEDINLTDSLIDYVNANAIGFDYDGNILLSCRHMDEITKIDRTTGNIIWRWGGIHCKNNQFTFLNDPIGFSHQHHIRRLPNGNYTMFDNGNLHDPQFSRAVEYQMDEANKLVTLIWEYRNEPTTYSGAMGSVQRLPDHNTLIGWGWNGSAKDISEVGADGTEKLSITFPDTMYSYRAFKYQWDNDFFTSNPEALNFGVVPVSNSSELSFQLTNNSNQSVEINSVYNRNSAFMLSAQLPVSIAAGNSVNLSVIFSPDSSGDYNDNLHLRWDSQGQRIAKVIHLSGVTDSSYLGLDDGQQPSDFSISQNYPNPFNPVSKIAYTIPKVSKVKLQVFDILGNKIATLVNKRQSAGSYVVEFDGSRLASGIYFYRFNAGEYYSVKKMLLLK